MRHRKHTAKLGRTGEHRNAMLANLVCSLIQHKRVTTTLAKAKAARPFAEKIVTLGKTGTLHSRRLASSRLKWKTRHMLSSKAQIVKARQRDVVRILFEEIAPAFKQRNGGYTRIVKLNKRQGDAAQMAILEWVEFIGEPAPTPIEAKPKAEKTEPPQAPTESPEAASQTEAAPEAAAAAEKV